MDPKKRKLEDELDALTISVPTSVLSECKEALSGRLKNADKKQTLVETLRALIEPDKNEQEPLQKNDTSGMETDRMGGEKELKTKDTKEITSCKKCSMNKEILRSLETKLEELKEKVKEKELELEYKSQTGEEPSDI
ncbi:uncharacterized protein LOC132193655 [Neocloeon triangulifer]|uniref:uncharacterized protein LOC132193655 n=1 Tax=Neocloeon triangulifer TaxID=2078957 RepID=UPI00286F5DD4|nr:uncharacterized protein LOC132193655 [Neocloeon triangulifer]